MRFELEVLDGDHKGKRLSLRSGFILGRTNSQLQFDDEEMSAQHAVLSYDQKKTWNIEALAPNRIRLGFDEVGRAVLILGLVFHLGQTGFKVVERQKKELRSWEEELKEWLEKNPSPSTYSEVFFFLKPVRLTFIQGPQFEEVYTFSYGPREIGYNNIDVCINDPSAPAKIARFFQVGDRAYIENLAGESVTINGARFDQHPIRQGDLLNITSSVIELSILS